MKSAQLRLSAFYIKDRERSPSLSVSLGLYAADKTRLGVQSVTIKNPTDKIEIGQTLLIPPGPIARETWRNGFVAETMTATGVQNTPYVGRSSPKIDGLDSATCKRLAEKIGSDFVWRIVSDPTLLNAFRNSKEKREIVAAACRAESEDASKVSKTAKRIVADLQWAGASKTRSRVLAVAYLAVEGKRGADSPYRLLFEGMQTFKIADRFAFKHDPKAAERDRAQGVVIAALRVLANDPGHILVTVDEITKRAWLDYGIAANDTRMAIDALIARRVVIEMERPGAATTVAFFGGKAPTFVGLASLVRAERDIAEFTNVSSSREVNTKSGAKIVESVIANAADLLARPGVRVGC